LDDLHSHWVAVNDNIRDIRRPHPQLTEFLARYDPSVRKLFLAARVLVLTEIPSASETVNDVSYTVVNAFTFSGRFKEAFCSVIAGRDYVNLGFQRGTELADPAGLLQGTGKLHRHVRIATSSDLKNPDLHQLIRAAADHASLLGGPVALKPQVKVVAARHTTATPPAPRRSSRS
jgi:hypothetical protein